MFHKSSNNVVIGLCEGKEGESFTGGVITSHCTHWDSPVYGERDVERQIPTETEIFCYLK